MNAVYERLNGVARARFQMGLVLLVTAFLAGGWHGVLIALILTGVMTNLVYGYDVIMMLLSKTKQDWYLNLGGISADLLPALKLGFRALAIVQILFLAIVVLVLIFVGPTWAGYMMAGEGAYAMFHALYYAFRKACQNKQDHHAENVAKIAEINAKYQASVSA